MRDFIKTSFISETSFYNILRPKGERPAAPPDLNVYGKKRRELAVYFRGAKRLKVTALTKWPQGIAAGNPRAIGATACMDWRSADYVPLARSKSSPLIDLSKSIRAIPETIRYTARWSSQAAHRTHNPEIVGPNPTRASIHVSSF